MAERHDHSNSSEDSEKLGQLAEECRGGVNLQRVITVNEGRIDGTATKGLGMGGSNAQQQGIPIRQV
jgi:hypothetical protein